jgi:hypothetical protein
MPLNEAAVAELVSTELARIKDPALVAALQRYLVAPRACTLDWDYGSEPAYPGFIVAEFHESGTGIAFSEHGFGPSSPWVLIWLDRPGFGMDCSAFRTLEGAFRDSMACDVPPPSGYEVE